MKALVLKANAQLEYMDVPMPVKPSENSCLVRVAACGICGSDLQRAFEHGAYHYPLVMGHEFSGTIEESFQGSRYDPGQRVAAFPLIPCMKCSACQTGDYAQCTSYSYLGSRCDGGFAEYVYVHEEYLFPVPDDVDILHAAMTEPCAVALHGVRKLNITGGETAAVYGGGPIGTIAAQWLRLRGCRRIIIIEVEKKKLEIARDMGFIAVDGSATDPVEAVRESTGGEGADKVVEACGLPLTCRQAVQSTGRFGEVVLLGNISGDFTISGRDFSSILRKELRLYGTWNSKVTPRGRDDWSAVLAHMDRELLVKPLISHTPWLAEGPEIFQRMFKKTEFFNKVIFKRSTA